jgi:hypothetical protein
VKKTVESGLSVRKAGRESREKPFKKTVDVPVLVRVPENCTRVPGSPATDGVERLRRISACATEGIAKLANVSEERARKEKRVGTDRDRPYCIDILPRMNLSVISRSVPGDLS